MKHLIDSQSLIWYVDQDHMLSRPAHAAITDPSNKLLLSAATIWEIAIKDGLKKLSLSVPYRQWLNQAIADLSLTILNITVNYADIQPSLPRHHGDPFDWLLIAQAMVENITSISVDAMFDQYGVGRIW